MIISNSDHEPLKEYPCKVSLQELTGFPRYKEELINHFLFSRKSAGPSREFADIIERGKLDMRLTMLYTYNQQLGQRGQSSKAYNAAIEQIGMQHLLSDPQNILSQIKLEKLSFEPFIKRLEKDAAAKKAEEDSTAENGGISSEKVSNERTLTTSLEQENNQLKQQLLELGQENAEQKKKIAQLEEYVEAIKEHNKHLIALQGN